MIDALRAQFLAGPVEYSLHAVRRMRARGITLPEVAEAMLAGEIIEEYPQDKYGPSCLIYGETAGGRALHLQVTTSRSPLKVITVYEPNPALWMAGRVRRAP